MVLSPANMWGTWGTNVGRGCVEKSFWKGLQRNCLWKAYNVAWIDGMD